MIIFQINHILIIIIAINKIKIRINICQVKLQLYKAYCETRIICR